MGGFSTAKMIEDYVDFRRSDGAQNVPNVPILTATFTVPGALNLHRTVYSVSQELCFERDWDFTHPKSGRKDVVFTSAHSLEDGSSGAPASKKRKLKNAKAAMVDSMLDDV